MTDSSANDVMRYGVTVYIYPVFKGIEARCYSCDWVVKGDDATALQVDAYDHLDSAHQPKEQDNAGNRHSSVGNRDRTDSGVRGGDSGAGSADSGADLSENSEGYADRYVDHTRPPTGGSRSRGSVEPEVKSLLESLYIGMPVHYYSYGTPNGEYRSCARAAVITEIPDQIMHLGPEEEDNPPHEPWVSLTVFNPKGVFHDTDVVYSSNKAPGHWGFVDFTVRRPIR